MYVVVFSFFYLTSGIPIISLHVRYESIEILYVSGLSGFFFIGIYFLFILSIIFTFLLKIKWGLILGFTGCLIMTINIIFPPLSFSLIVLKHGNILSTSMDIGYAIGYTFYINILFIQVINLILFWTINIVLYRAKSIIKEINFNIIKKTILDLGTQYANLEVREISEACNLDKVTIIEIINDMIENNEIYAEYFKSNKQSNIKEIDNLMAMYQDWEEKEEAKI